MTAGESWRTEALQMPASTALSQHDRAYLNGEHGPGAQLAMRVLVAVANAMDAPTLIDVHSAHVDGCLYVGAVSIDFVKALVDGGARGRYPPRSTSARLICGTRNTGMALRTWRHMPGS